jgi:hypothetical protein
MLWRFVTAAALVATAGIAPALARQDAAPEAAQAELAKKLQNPVASLISVPFQMNYDFGIGPDGDEGGRFVMNVQPVIPISLNDHWNLISRTILPVIDMDSPISGDDDLTGIGDVLQSAFFSPKDPVGGWIVGFGPVLGIPTASEEALGSDKWTAGPTFVVLRQQSGFTFGVLANHVWSFAGDHDREDVTATFLQPFLSYTTKTATSFGLNTEALYDWEHEEWTVPLNATASQVLKLGRQPLSVTLGARYYADQPTFGPEWGLRLALTLLFPK